VKVDDCGLHDKDDLYVWYEPDSTKNGGFAGYQKPSDYYGPTQSDAICYGHTAGNSSTYCNTRAYVERVNAAGWCGANDWRMPTVGELQSLAMYDRYGAGGSIDSAYFPNVAYLYGVSYWSGVSDSVGGALGARYLSFRAGWASLDAKYIWKYVMLVRDGQ
jgi:hypothetical protein